MSRPGPAPSLGPPPATAEELAEFPASELSTETELFRVVRRGRAPWWFGSSMAGRFDLPAPAGTCYLATDPLAALLEALGPFRRGGAVTIPFLEARELRRLFLPASERAADATSRRAAGFGITAEIGTILPYDLPQRWALRWHEAGFGAVIYWLRHDPSRGRGVALFGRAGARKRWRRGRARGIHRELIARLERECGVRVLRIPRSAELSWADDP